MKTGYLIAKYVDDLGRNEPDNVGIIVYDDERAVARFDGEEEGQKLDLRKVRYRIPASRTYRAWVEYWRRALEDPTILDSALKDARPGSPPVIERLLEAASSDFYLEPGGAVIMDLDERALEDTARDLYDRLVKQPDPPAPKNLRQRSEDALKLAGAPVEDEARFKKDFRIEIDVEGTVVNGEVSFAIQNEHWHFLQEVGFDYQRPRVSRKEANNAAFLLEHGGWRNEQRLILYDQTDIGKGQYALLEMLMKFAPVVDVSNPEKAAGRLHERLGLG